MENGCPLYRTLINMVLRLFNREWTISELFTVLALFEEYLSSTTVLSELTLYRNNFAVCDIATVLPNAS